MKVLEKVTPGRFRLNKGELVIGSRTPDFYEAKGKRLVEAFGDYWHATSEEGELITYYKGRGYSCLVLWEEEVCCFPIEARVKYFASGRFMRFILDTKRNLGRLVSKIKGFRQSYTVKEVAKVPR